MKTYDRSPFERVKDAVEGPITQSGEWYNARCPAHDDTNPSFGFRETGDGGVAVNCQAGCSRDDIIRGLGFDDWRDLYSTCSADWKPWDGDLVDRYTYRDADGNPLFQVVRYEMRDTGHPAYGEKQFMQHAYLPDHPDAGKHDCESGFVPGRAKHGVDVALYNLPKVAQAVRYGDPIFDTEGEKDADTLGNMGLVGTTLPQGASEDPTIPEHVIEPLRGADVVLLPDNDEAGRTFMEAMANRVAPIARSVKIVTLPGLRHKEDVTDWVKRHGGTKADLLDLVEATDPHEWTPQSAEDLATYCEGGGVSPDLVFDHIDVLAEAPPDRLSSLKRRLKDATGINLNDLRSALKAAKERIERERAERERAEALDALSDGAPVVKLNDRRSVDVVDEICDILEKVNEEGDLPRLFRRSEIVEIEESEGGPTIEPLHEAAVDDMVSRYTCCVVERKPKDGGPPIPSPKDPPLRVIRRVEYRLDLPHLDAISEVPILRPDGSVRDTPGYDEATRLAYIPSADPVPVPENPGKSAVRDATALLAEVWRDHPFADAASEAAAFALALTPVVLPMMEGANTPLCIISATQQGSGKTILGESIGTVGTGRRPPVLGAPEGEAEWRKQVTALLRKGTRFGVIDDVSGTLDSAALRRALTSATLSDRVLGASTQVQLPADTVWCATGNNLRPSGDMVRRCYLVRLDTEMQRPWERTGFTHVQPDWTVENRSKLASAALTLARAWIVAGRPAPPDSVPQMGSFEMWRETVGGILHHAGVTGFLGNLSALTDSIFVEDDDWGRLLTAVAVWEQQQDGTGFTTRRLAHCIEGEMAKEDRIRDNTIMKIVDWLPDGIRRKLARHDPIAKALGKAFGYRKGRVFTGGYRLTICRDSNAGKVWTVEKVTLDDQSPTSRAPATTSTNFPRWGGGSDAKSAEDESKVSNTDTYPEDPPF